MFEGAARPAALVLGAEETGHAGESFGVLHGLYWVVVGLASEAPLVLCVDDVQWADRPSLRFLVHLARRLESTSVRLLLGLRTSEAASADDLLHELRSSAGACIVRPSPLSADAVVTWSAASWVSARTGISVSRVTGRAAATRSTCVSCSGASWPAPSSRPVSRSSTWPECGRRRSLGTCSPGSRGSGRARADLAGAMAVLGDGGRLRHAAALAGVREAGALARALREMEILAEDEPFRFSHPIVRGAVYADLPHDRRERLHRGPRA